MQNSSDVVIIGGGLAGLCASINLRKLGHSVRLIEKMSYPHHKVCGEYISNEVLPYLKYLGLDPFGLGATPISRLKISQTNGNTIETRLPLGGFGISRYTLDSALANLAINNGVRIEHDTVTGISFHNNKHSVNTKSGAVYSASVAIAASGKRSNLDKAMAREFIQKQAPYLAVKWHAQGEFPPDLVALHNFNGGYCGVSRVEDNRINLCFIATYNAFKKYKDIGAFIAQELDKNPELKKLTASTKDYFEQPLSIGQISFKAKPTIEDHVLMCGDAAGLIHPLCGNGMSMAIHGAKIASQTISQFLNNTLNRSQMERSYSKLWKKQFSTRLQTGRAAAYIFSNATAMKATWNIMYAIPSLLPKLIKRTHGKPIDMAYD